MPGFCTQQPAGFCKAGDREYGTHYQHHSGNGDRYCLYARVLWNNVAEYIFLIIICNMIHYFSTPYLMIKNALLKLNTSWEATAKLLGDSWGKTLLRIITPNMSSTLMEVSDTIL